jgi:pimeloyl-ACP methyl ester carboxylesterase
MDNYNTTDIDNPNAFNHQFADINGIRMHYVEEGKGPLVILLHGFPFLWYLWRHQIRALAAAGYRVVAPDQRGYGQTSQPKDLIDYDVTRLVGDVVGLVNHLGEKSAVIVGQDWGSPISYFSSVMRPDLFRAVFMMCSPPDAWTPVRPSQARAAAPQYADLNFYQEYLGRPTTVAEIMADVRSFLSGLYYSTSGSCAEEERWRWVWKHDEKFSDTYVVPETLPAYMSQQALDYYVSEYTRAGIQAPINWYKAIESDWSARAFLHGVIAHQPASFLTGERDPSLRVLMGIDRQGPAFRSLQTNFPNLKDVIKVPRVGHTPPEENPAVVNAALLKFLGSL